MKKLLILSLRSLNLALNFAKFCYFLISKGLFYCIKFPYLILFLVVELLYSEVILHLSIEFLKGIVLQRSSLGYLNFL